MKTLQTLASASLQLEAPTPKHIQNCHFTMAENLSLLKLDGVAPVVADPPDANFTSRRDINNLGRG